VNCGQNPKTEFFGRAEVPSEPEMEEIPFRQETEKGPHLQDETQKRSNNESLSEPKLNVSWLGNACEESNFELVWSIQETRVRCVVLQRLDEISFDRPEAKRTKTSDVVRTT